MSRKPAVLHVPADDPDHLGAKPQVALELLAAQVEPAVAQPERLVDVLLVELEGQRRRPRDDLEGVERELDFPRRHARIDGVGRPRDDLASRLEHELVANLSRELGGRRRPLGVDDELRDPAPVAKIDEHEAAVVAASRDPPGERDRPTGVLGPRLAAHEVSPAHVESLETISS